MTSEVGVWEFAPPVVTDPRPRPAGERPLIREVLHAAAALPIAFWLEWHAGPAASVRLRTDDPVSRRWVERVLLPAYGPHRWRPVARWRTQAPTTCVDGRPVWFGRPEGPATGSLSQDEPRPWSDAVLRALPAFERARCARWRFRAAGAGARAPQVWDPIEPTRVPLGFRPRPLTRPEQEERDRRARRLRAARWVAEVRIETATPAVPGPDPFCSLVALASGRDGDQRLRFRRATALWRRRPRAFLVSDLEVAGVLPAHDSIFWAVPATGGPADGISAGRDGLGRPLQLPLRPSEGRHLLVVGETGMGKSSLLLRLALEAAARGSVVLFDPVGDTGRRFLTALPAGLRHRVVWVAPGVSPVSIDLMRSLREGGPGSVAAERALADVVDALRRVRAARFADTPFWGPRIEETVRAALRAAAAIPGATLLDADRLLSATGRQVGSVPPEAREVVGSLLDRVRDRPEEVDGSRRLLHELTERPAIRQLLAERSSTFTISQLHAPHGIVVITGEAPTVGESSARYLLAVYLALFWSSRQRAPTQSKTFLVLDEAQWYAHESLAEMLRLGRRSNLHVWLATQSLASLSEGVREAVRTNVADIAAFRGSPDDARDLARLSGAVTEQSLASLPRGEATLLIGKGEHVSFLRTLEPRRPRAAASTDAEAAVLEASRRYWPADLPTDGGGAPSGAHDEERHRELALVLWAGLLEVAPAPTVRVPLEALRRSCDPGGLAVRALGRRLRELDLLRATGHDVDGAYWEVARDGMDALLGGGVGPEELARAEAKWRGMGSHPGVRS